MQLFRGVRAARRELKAATPDATTVETSNQIFNEVWRQERDYFFEASMNGVDWEKERERYAPLLPYLADRYDLTYVLGEMIGELSNSHTYVGGGDYPDLKPINVGVLARILKLTPPAGSTASRRFIPERTGMPRSARRLPSPAWM